MTHAKITKHFTHTNPITKHHEKWVEIYVPKEPTKVLGIQVRCNHVYNAPVKDLHHPDKYFDPLFTSHYDNTQHNFLAYRKKLGLMPTKVIIQKRKHYHLTEKQTAKVLHINPVHYHMIEQGNLQREKEWYQNLFVLTKPKIMRSRIAKLLNK